MCNMPSIYNFVPALNNTDFIIGEDDFNDLSINPMPNADMYYFRSRNKSLITRFVIKRTEQIEKSVTVTLTKNENGKYAPRFDFSIYNVTKKSLAEYKAGAVDQSKLAIKAKVSITDHESSIAFNKLLAYVSGLSNIELDNKTYKTVSEDYVVGLEEALEAVSKDEVLKVLSSKYKGKLTVKDINLILKRKEALATFYKLLNDKTYFEEIRNKLGDNKRPEDVWQVFFNANQWIFGYGLKLVSTESINPEKLEQITTGANIFEGAGKRVDGLLRTKGYFGSLVFAEIKTNEKDLLVGTPYRPPDTYRASAEVIGGVAQVQKTAYKAVRKMGSEFEKHYNSDGSYSGIDYSTIKPIQILVIGNLNQLTSNGEINTEMLASFELYRKSNTDVEILTFDELYERAKYIVG